jgi:hypothetical protein
MLITVLHWLNAETTWLSNFMDIEDTPFFQKSIIIAQYYWIIDGTKIGWLNYFFPHNEILRWEAAKIISKTFLE